jgi:hypothetical protein
MAYLKALVRLDQLDGWSSLLHFLPKQCSKSNPPLPGELPLHTAKWGQAAVFILELDSSYLQKGQAQPNSLATGFI